jgi:hypothetical protein
MMFFSHLIKMAEYFVANDFPEVSFEELPIAIEGLIYNAIKLIEIYYSGFV